MIYGYIRVSTDKQDTENQKFEIIKFCEQENITIDKWIQETISGTKDPKKRKLGLLLKKVNKDDLIISCELSRFGRSLYMIMEILKGLLEKEVNVWTIKDNYRLDDSIQAKVLSFAFGLAAEIERDMISKRTKEALKKKRAEGVKLGRPIGSKNKQTQLTNKTKDVVDLITSGHSVLEVSKILKVHRATLSWYLKEIHLKPKNYIQIYRKRHDEIKRAKAQMEVNNSEMPLLIEVVKKTKELKLEGMDTRIKEMLNKKYSLQRIAMVFDVSRSCVEKYIKKKGL